MQTNDSARLPDLHATETLRCNLLRASLDQNSTIESIVGLLLEGARSLVGFSAMAVYLLNRQGKLERVGIAGSEPRRVWPDLKALDLELARRAFPCWEEALPYAEPLIDRTGTFIDHSGLRSYYENEIGTYTSAVRIPLNGSNQTFGILEAINLDPDPIDARSITASWEDTVRRLIAIAMVCSSAITVWRARQESLTLGDVMKVLLTDDLDPNVDDWWQQVQHRATQALAVLSREQAAFRAAVIHVRRGEEMVIEPLAKSAEPELSWNSWKDISIESGKFLAGQVFLTGRRRLLAPITQADRHLLRTGVG
jgi:hypothetical protein